MRVAVYGGSFNPPHVAHQLAITYVLATARPRIDELWLVPTFKHPFDKQLAPYEDRVRMCELAAGPFGDKVKLSRIEEELGGESYTLRTVKALMERHPGVELALVIGADLVAERERWHGWPELKELVRFIVVGRQGQPSAGGIELPGVSSTIVRQRVARGESIDALVAADVVEYIAARGLYR
ncbi:MAG: nicotinate (nicotinamide) nucleotide adenylyltransferase [Myxococcales bacterium]|nr:nicotinate (nicotinamide) nucleotide adenylyltransferase [Myxococcales bacterium]